VDRWEELFHQPDPASRPPACNTLNTNKTILVTGAGGCIGSALAKTIIAANPGLLVLLDHSEENLYRIQTELESLASAAPHLAILGDIADRDLLAELFENHQPDIIYHAAAYKHVPLMETNPLAVVRNNVFGTQALAQIAVQFKTPRFIMISTDKAVHPQSVMGVSKRIAELLLLRLSGGKTRTSAVRFGNVFGSNGSVVPRFAQQIARGGPVTVTHPDARRYFITLSEAVEIILAAASLGESGLFIPQLGEPVKILDLAKRMIGAEGTTPVRPIEIAFTGLRPGEKLTEQLLSKDESIEPTSDPILFRVKGPRIADEQLDSALQKLSESVKNRNLAETLETVSGLVPEYTPSEALLHQLKPSLAAQKP
jgi:FlaA1/EpsC-like NDP-sugar epimerase